ncbi:heme-binding protein [Hydrogenophaga sp. PAMC20947]|uniref:SOUL family heme-binding protein n=1 Tax=Hydrogenophaga sp. PAMC20947 TaxID=2565558 RepID=UPI00109DFA02|nr:heme-binding protein [Hydrogenophaga sp. PAMC20947]QCB44637.1 heme-binding protein [Hydrogenophaga sp. PAMC20947]
MKWLIPLVLATMPFVAHATEEPAFEVAQQLDGAQVRAYAPYVVAEVLVDGPAEQAGSAAFPILAGYIFGKNKGERKLDMTAPVTQSAVPVKLEMTAPVTQASAPGGYVVQFALPRGVTLATAPEPLDSRVRLREVSGARVAVIRYSGFWSQANFDEHLGKLQTILRGAQIAWTGEPVLSRYDPPYMPWFLRRNEIWLTVATPATASKEGVQ